MKKTVLLFISVVMALGVAAQSHSFRDTSYMKYWQFDLVGFLGDTTGPLRRGYNQMGGPVFPPGTGSLMGRDDVLQYNYTDNPDGMRVIGISAVIEMGGPNQGCPMDPPEYLLLYDALTDTFELKAMIQWEICDTAGRPWYDWIVNAEDGKPTTWSEAFGASGPPHYYRVFDMYFDEPVTVYDSFYVGGTQRMLLGNSNRGTSYFCYTLVFMDTTTMVPIYNSSILWKIYSYESHGGNCTPNQWHWTQTSQWMMVLPIIEVVDTSFANAPTCPRVSGLFARGNYTDTVKVQWDYDSLHQEFELSYGRDGTRPDEGTVVTLMDNKWVFTDTAYSDTPMVAYVRTVCREYDTLRRSGWSSPVYFRLHCERPDTTHHEGISVPDEKGDLSRFVQLMPNPAAGRTTVLSSYGIVRVEVYDVRGERVLDQAAHGTTASFDVTGWQAGAYVVLVRTPAGTIAKRLIVE